MNTKTTTTLTSEEIDSASLLGKRVLIADDNPVNLQIAKSVLNKWGIVVSSANNGMEASELFKTEDYDCILMDIHMPVMSGLEASKAIRDFEKLHQRKATPIVAFTADVFMDESIFQEMEINTKLYKPFDIQELKELLIKLTLRKEEVESNAKSEIYRSLQSNLN